MGRVETARTILVSRLPGSPQTERGILLIISPVFKAMSDICEGNTSQREIRLTDSVLEWADNLRTCFAVIERLTDDDDHNNNSVWRLYRCSDLPMIFFAQKYEIKPMIDGIRLYMFRAATQFSPRGGCFSFVAAALGKWDLFGKLVMSLDESLRGNGESPREEQARRMLDWRAWTPTIVRQLSQINDGLPWAICQVGTKHANSLTGQINYAAMGPDLARVMHL